MMASLRGRWGVTQPDDVRLTEGAPEAAVTRGDVALGVQVGADRPPGSTETPSAGGASALLRQPLDPAPF